MNAAIGLVGLNKQFAILKGEKREGFQDKIPRFDLMLQNI